MQLILYSESGVFGLSWLGRRSIEQLPPHRLENNSWGGTVKVIYNNAHHSFPELITGAFQIVFWKTSCPKQRYSTRNDMKAVNPPNGKMFGSSSLRVILCQVKDLALKHAAAPFRPETRADEFPQRRLLQWQLPAAHTPTDWNVFEPVKLIKNEMKQADERRFLRRVHSSYSGTWRSNS